MKKHIIILSEREHRRQPGMCCIVEMENALIDEYQAVLIDPAAPLLPRNLSDTVAIFTAISFGSIEPHIDLFISLRKRGATVVVYIYDPWRAEHFFYNPKRRLKSRFFSKYKITEFCDWLVVPFQQSVEEFSAADRNQVVHMPLGVDCTLVNGSNKDRPFTVLAYGRQPTDVMGFFSEALNSPGTPFLMHHTDHMQIGNINNYLTYRRQFWKIAEKSAVALAYDPKGTHGQRFPYSVIGQRWYESLAAGCVVVGVRPKTPEANVLLDWSDATIEAPASAQGTLSLVLELAQDPVRLGEIRERNIANIRSRHDWRVRFREFFETILPT